MYFILLNLFLSLSSIASEDEICNSETNDEISKLTCSIQDIAADIVAGKEVVPSHIYHYGRKEHLMKNIAAGNVPQADWDKFIMGDVTRFKLGSTRRGLYGTGGLASNGYGDGEYNWLMEIKIKDECRKPDRVISLSKIEKNQRFIDWYKSSKLELTFEEFKVQCKMESFDGYKSEACEKVISNFLKDLNIGVIHDHFVTESFYIRDRNCVETISGSPDEWPRILAENSALWLHKCGYSDQIQTLPSLLARSLSTMKSQLPPEQAEKIRDNLNLLLGDTDQEQKKIVVSIIDAKLRCDKLAKDELINTLPAEKYDGLGIISVIEAIEIEKLCQ